MILVPPLNRLLGRLLVGLFVVGACLLPLGGASAAAAAPCACAADPTVVVTVKDQVRAASAVFLGTVESITPPPSGSAQNGFSRTGTVRVERVYKPNEYELITTDTVDVVTPSSFGDCTRNLQQGETYVFFVESDEGFTATGCGGTATATSKLITQVERFLGEGRGPVPPEPETATLTDVNTDDPTTLTRLAAPGLALVIVGLLGLTVVRRLARPRP